MPLTPQACGAVLLAGGQSRRMGICKAQLVIGGETLLARTARQLELFDERLLSTNDNSLAPGLALTPVADIYPHAGPLGGLHAALSATKKEALFCVPCDLPNFTAELPMLLMQRFPYGADAMVCMDASGRLQPLCGVYHSRVLPQLQALLEQGVYRVRALLESVNCAYLNTKGLLPEGIFYNVNTPEDLLRLNE